MKRLVAFCLVGVAIGLLCGCGKPKGEAGPSAGVPPPVSPGMQAFEKAREHYYAGNTNAAIECLAAAIAKPECAPDLPVLGRGLIELLLMADRLADAQQRYLDLATSNEAAAAACFGNIESRLSGRDEPAALLEWTTRLVALPVTGALGERFWTAHADALVGAGQFDGLRALSTKAVETFGGAGAARILAAACNRLLGANNIGELDKLLGVVEPRAAASPELSDFVTCTRWREAAGQGAWEKVAAQFAERAAGVQDGALSDCLASLVSQALAATQAAAAGQLVDHALGTLRAKPRTWERAAHLAVTIAEKSGKAEAVAACFDRLRAAGVPADTILRDLSRVFYSTVADGAAPTRASLLATCDWLLTQIADKAQQDQITAMEMDGAVLSDDYARALKILKGGFRAEEKEWHEMALNKVQAHLALQEGRKDEAVERFRGFMEHVKTWKDATTDPATGLTFSREMSLGMNAKRIADILASAGKKDEAAKAYAEADAYYAEALSKVMADSKEAEYIKKEQAALKSAMGK